MCTEQYKPICIVVYTCLIVFLPPMPSSYTLVINFLGYMVSMGAAVFTIYFLNTRPLQQKNLLKRVFILLMGSLILLSSRSFFISVIYPTSGTMSLKYLWRTILPLCIFYPIDYLYYSLLDCWLASQQVDCYCTLGL